MGTLAPPVRVVKAAPRLVLDAQLAWAGPFVHVFAKILPLNERSIEAVCAWLARQAELQAPAPCFLRMQRTRMPKGHQCGSSETAAKKWYLRQSRWSRGSSWFAWMAPL